MTLNYRDNYPNNIEAPQRVYVQYSQDINFDYSTGKYPLGETFEGFIWENVYVPIQHTLGDLTLGRHTWMRWRIGEKEAWTLPMRLTDSILNIETTTIEYETNPNQIKFKFKYTLNTGQVVYSEYMYIPMPEDGRGILNSQITNNNLILTYTDGTTQNVGRVVGYDGTGVPIGTDDYNILISLNDEPQWISLISQLNNNLSGTLPIIYNDGVYSHSNSNGYRHIPVGGNDTDCLITDGSGNYTWEQRIPFTAINDSAGIGDTTELWSADKIATMFSTLQTFGIKYSVELIADLALILDMEDGDLAVVNEDRYVYKYNEGTLTWNQFFQLDAPHNHDSLYYRKTELQTSGQSSVHWDNITNVPTLFSGWNISDGNITTLISEGDTLNIIGDGLTATLSGNDLTLSVDSIYTAGTAIDITGNIISHEDTSPITNVTNSGGYVIKNLAYDTFGHVLSQTNVDLHEVYAFKVHSHAVLTRGNGLTGNNYDGSIGSTWAVDFAGTGVANTASRSDHTHTTLPNVTSGGIPFGYGVWASSSAKASKVDYTGFSIITVKVFAFGNVTASFGTYLGNIVAPYRPSGRLSCATSYYIIGQYQGDIGHTGLLCIDNYGDVYWGDNGVRNLIGINFSFSFII